MFPTHNQFVKACVGVTGVRMLQGSTSAATVVAIAAAEFAHRGTETNNTPLSTAVREASVATETPRSDFVIPKARKPCISLARG